MGKKITHMHNNTKIKECLRTSFHSLDTLTMLRVQCPIQPTFLVNSMPSILIQHVKKLIPIHTNGIIDFSLT